jgi:hypothetical protein
MPALVAFCNPENGCPKAEHTASRRETNVHQYTVQALIALILVSNLSLGMAAAPAVGIMTARGSFTIDNSSIAGNATLFEGNQIETGRASSQLQLNNGARMQLAAESRGIVYRDRLVLERGSGRFENYGVEALSLRIRAEGGNTAAEVSVQKASVAGPGRVEVAALNGPVRVTAANGVLLANVQAGRTLAFVPDNTALVTATTVTGCLESAGGKFLLTDEASLVRFQILGAGMSKELGHRVNIAGSVTPIPEALSQIQTTSVKMLSTKCSHRTTAAAAAGVGAAGAGAAGAGAGGAATAAGVGMAVATKAIIAGVIIAGAASGAAVAVVKSEDPAPISPSGR